MEIESITVLFASAEKEEKVGRVKKEIKGKVDRAGEGRGGCLP